MLDGKNSGWHVVLVKVYQFNLYQALYIIKNSVFVALVFCDSNQVAGAGLIVKIKSRVNPRELREV